MQFHDLARIEPLLGSLMQEAASTLDTGGDSFCANRIWYQRFKPRLERLVGWRRGDGPESLKSTDAYGISSLPVALLRLKRPASKSSMYFSALPV